MLLAVTIEFFFFSCGPASRRVPASRSPLGVGDGAVLASHATTLLRQIQLGRLNTSTAKMHFTTKSPSFPPRTQFELLCRCGSGAGKLDAEVSAAERCPSSGSVPADLQTFTQCPWHAFGRSEDQAGRVCPHNRDWAGSTMPPVPSLVLVHNLTRVIDGGLKPRQTCLDCVQRCLTRAHRPLAFVAPTGGDDKIWGVDLMNGLGTGYMEGT
ncbi:hypothetical protein FPV67DRAFT_1729347 [Lyophyllum atratum]|nr:hypothetical protein FPV67DRAFT_1729347 [Lyophyllum atratum]